MFNAQLAVKIVLATFALSMAAAVGVILFIIDGLPGAGSMTLAAFNLGMLGVAFCCITIAVLTVRSKLW